MNPLESFFFGPYGKDGSLKLVKVQEMKEMLAATDEMCSLLEEDQQNEPDNKKLEFADNRDLLERRNGMLPAGDVLVLAGDVEFFFTTLWTKINPTFLWAVQRGMNDFRYGILDGMRFTANDVDSLHGISVAWLGSALKVSTAEHKIIVTHHCPTMRLPFNAIPDSTLNSAFQVDMDSFIEDCGADYWIYGHTHFAGGSGTVIGKTQLLCNQMGYVYYNEHHDFNPSAVIEV